MPAIEFNTQLGAAAEVLGGIGVFFFAIHFLSQNLRQLASQRLRLRIARMTDHPVRGVIVGAFMITITQSGSASVFLMVGLLRAGMLTLRQAQPVLLGVNIAAGLTVLFLTLEIHNFVMLLIGLAGITYVYGSIRLQRFASVALGIGLLFLGLEIMRQGASSAEEQEWFQNMIGMTRGQPVLAFVVGAILTIISQSSMAVVVVMATFLDAGLFEQSDAMMFVYGTNVGASVLTYLMASGLTGVARQVALYQVGYNLVAASILVPLFYAETLFNIPLVASLSSWLTDDPSQQTASIYILFNVIPLPLLILTLGFTAKTLIKIAPETAVEQSSKPKYLSGQLPTDPAIALRLIELEQNRLIGLLIAGLNTFRKEKADRELAETLDAFDTLAKTIKAAIEETTERAVLDAGCYEYLDNLLKIQNSLDGANNTLVGLAEELFQLKQATDSLPFPTTAVEGLDLIFHILADVAHKRHPQDIEMLARMTSDEGNGTSSVRAAYLTNEGAVNPSDRVHLLAAANYCERLIWLTREACDAYRKLPAS